MSTSFAQIIATSLSFPIASPDKSGMYMVKASNEAGNAQSIADVVVLDDRKRTQGGGVTIFESTVGISDVSLSIQRLFLL